ncbi:MAG: hypothetical protein Q8891_07225 [Bacteroidota bacterium]|nr:hypothetical protein [Bacteroidota bacterium]
MKASIVKILIAGCALLLFLAIAQPGNAQDTTSNAIINTEKKSHWSVNGYLKDLQTTQFVDINKKWTLENLVHNRVDVRWFHDSAWKFHLGIRNRFFYGDSAALSIQDALLQNSNDGYFDLSKTIAKGPSFLLNSTIDRASVDYTHGKWEITAGRQRINWGLNLVWNPNDIFNAYSYFDFDYEERPGTDAVRVQYYLNSTSSAEIAYKPGRNANETIAAGLYRFTKGSYDIQALAGIVNTDYVLGGGWSGVLGQAGFNGEISAFIPRKNFQLSNTVISASLGVNYTFPNSLYLHGAYLLNSSGLLKGDNLSPSFFLINVSAKSLSPARHSLFAEAAYQFNPLIRGDFSGIYTPADGSFFIGPFFTFSLTNTIELLTGGQLFFGGKQSLYSNYGKVLFLRFKWSF